MSEPREGREPVIEDSGRSDTQVKLTARQQRVEVLIGLLGFFTVAAFVTTLVAEVRGKPALTEALVLAAFVLATFLAVRAWRRGQRPTQQH